MDERQQLYEDLKRYRALRDLTTDEVAIEAIDIMIREAEQRLAELENGPADKVLWPSSFSGGPRPNVLSMCESAGTAASVLATTLSRPLLTVTAFPFGRKGPTRSLEGPTVRIPFPPAASHVRT
jgi:hypothetical protein